MFLKLYSLSCLILLTTTACAKTQIIPVPTLIKNEPPLELLVETKIPSLTGGTNGDLLEYILALQHSVLMCNQDKQKISQWFSN